MKNWAVITGAGTGIGAAVAKELASLDFQVLAIGRREKPLEVTKSQAQNQDNIHILPLDIAAKDSCQRILNAIPANDCIKYLIQNAAVGVPGKLLDIDQDHFEYAMRVNVTAPLMLTKSLFERMNCFGGRIVHLGTGVAFKPQLGTSTYGITKMAFHRLYQQLQVELKDTKVQIANLLPGVVDTEGLSEHIRLANVLNLPHVQYFDQVHKAGQMYKTATVAKFVKFVLLETKDNEFSKEWNIHDETHWSRWRQ